jgi:hypothetical protein
MTLLESLTQSFRSTKLLRAFAGPCCEATRLYHWNARLLPITLTPLLVVHSSVVVNTRSHTDPLLVAFGHQNAKNAKQQQQQKKA